MVKDKNPIMIMQRLIKWSQVFYILLIIYSCQSGKGSEKVFPLEQAISAVHISISEIIKIGNIYKMKDFCILRDIQSNAKYHFYVYSYPEFKFLYSFCPRGNGAEEYLMPTVIKNTNGNIFSFRDHATDKFVTYLLNDTSATLVDEFQMISNNDRFFWEINYICDDKFVLKNSNDRQSSRELRNIKDNIRLDTLPNSFDIASNMGENYNTEFDDVWISASNNNVAFAYFFIDRIELGTVEGEKLRVNYSVGESSVPDFYSFTENPAFGKYKYNVDNNVVYYEDLVSTPQSVYGLYAGIPWGDLDKHHSSLIEVYDWKGTPLKLLKLNESIASMIIDESEKRIYGINPDSNDDSILMFRYN